MRWRTAYHFSARVTSTEVRADFQRWRTSTTALAHRTPTEACVLTLAVMGQVWIDWRSSSSITDHATAGSRGPVRGKAGNEAAKSSAAAAAAAAIVEEAQRAVVRLVVHRIGGGGGGGVGREQRRRRR